MTLNLRFNAPPLLGLHHVQPSPGARGWEPGALHTLGKLSTAAAHPLPNFSYSEESDAFWLIGLYSHCSRKSPALEPPVCDRHTHFTTEPLPQPLPGGC